MFFIGQKVECIDPTWGTTSLLQLKCCPNLPIKGRIYHIRTCEPANSSNSEINREAKCWVRLVEIVNPIICGKEEPIFMGSKYRPVYDLDNDISIFHEILLKASVKV